MSTAFLRIHSTTPGDAVRGLIGRAARKSDQEERRMVEKMCVGLDWERMDVLRLADNAVGHLGQMLDEGIVSRFAGAVGEHPHALAFRTRMLAAEPEEEVEEGKRPTDYRFLMSDAQEDRASDIVEQDWILEDFRSNPIAPYNHSYYAPPVGKWAKLSANALRLAGSFVPFRPSVASVHPMAVMVDEMMAARVLVTCSVGFRPRAVIARASLDENDPRFGDKGLIYVGNNLLECSPTPMPMNPRAAMRSVESAQPPQSKSAPAEKPATLWGAVPTTKMPWS